MEGGGLLKTLTLKVLSYWSKKKLTIAHNLEYKKGTCHKVISTMTSISCSIGAYDDNSNDRL